MKKYVVIDTYATETSLEEILEGVVKHSFSHFNINYLLVGDRIKIETYLKDKQVDFSRFIIENSTDYITNHDNPMKILANRDNSTLIKSMILLKNSRQALGLITAGATGAIFTSSIFKLGLQRGLKMPVLGAILPNINQSSYLIVECGANVNCKELDLLNFAKVGSKFIKKFKKIEKPRIALLNVGNEKEKGSDLVKKTYGILLESGLNFVGNVEANQIFEDKFDVLVTDGFTGNMIIKNSEYVAMLVKEEAKKYITNEDELNKFNENIDSKFAYTEKDGAIMLGTIKPIVKLHGKCSSTSVYNSINQLMNLL